ncbi:hypothetical protein FRB90_004845 [Tulasnella sp. 427]|nr:hypothetical protein FRB90_004845 [Tulasnella sp. 427]
MADRGRGRGRGRGGGGPGGGAGPARGGGPPSVSSAGTGGGGAGRGAGRGGGAQRGGGPPSVSSAGTGGTGGRGAPRGGGPDRGGGRGAGPGRGRGGGGGGGGGGPLVAGVAATGGVSIANSVVPIGCKRPSYATFGVPVDVIVNCFRADVPTGMIYHYDTILPEDKTLPPRATVHIIRQMQEQNRTIFTKRGCYDGRKNLYSVVKYSFGQNAQFEVTEPDRKNPWRVRIQFAAEINPASTERYIQGQMSYDERISTTLNACNVAIRMQPIQDNPFNARSFFTRNEFKDMGRGLELWRGYFQSVRPVIGKMVINLDISSAAFYKSGPLIKLCLELLGRSPEADPTPFLSASRMDARARKDLLKLIRNLKVKTIRGTVYGIKDIPDRGADSLMFKKDDGSLTSVQAYMSQIYGKRLRYPGLICVQVTQKASYPIELCEVTPGQFYRRTLTPEHTKHMVEFSTLRPDERLRNIRNGLQVLRYGNSSYLQDFGINVDVNPMTIKGRILPPPALEYGKKQVIQPRDGQWNMRGKQLFKPEKISGCAILIYDRRFGQDREAHLKRSLFDVAQMLGITGMPPDPPVMRKDATGSQYWLHLRDVAMHHKSIKGNMPNLVVVVLPDMAEDVYLRIKNAGDIRIGVATQCLRSFKCGKGNEQYYVNVCLKINAKLGGINVIPKPDNVRFLTDRAIPTIVIGADVEHPGPGNMTRPSHAAVVGSIDMDASKYVATSRAQPCRREMIDDLADMVAHVLNKYMQYRKEVEKNPNPAPRRILFYRDGISEGQFKECKDYEVKQIYKACDRIGIPRPKLTFVVVGKRHHIRFFPQNNANADRSGNAPAGLVVDRDITSPVEYDFYLQSHGGLLGTSRSAHYNVLVDENNFMPDE